MEQVINERPFFEGPQIKQQQTSTYGTPGVFGAEFQDLSHGWYPNRQTGLSRTPIPTNFSRGSFPHQRSFEYNHYEPGSRPAVCRNFIQGKCSYGAACKFQHSNSHRNGGFGSTYGGEYLANAGVVETCRFSRAKMDDGLRSRPFSQVGQYFSPNIAHVRPTYDRVAHLQEFSPVLGNPGFGKRHVENITSCPNNNYLGSRSCPRGQMNRTPCRYFPNGTCFRGASCPYLHPFHDSGSQQGQQLVVTSGQPEFERTMNVIPRCNQHDKFMSHRVQQQSLDSGMFSQENQDISSRRGLHSFDDGKIEVKLCRKLIMGRCELGESCRDLHSFHAAYARSVAVGNEQPHFKSSTAVRDSGVLHQSSGSSKDLEPTETLGDDKVKQDCEGFVIEPCEISTSVGKNAVNADVIGSDSTVLCEKNYHTSPVASVLDKDGGSEKTEAHVRPTYDRGAQLQEYSPVVGNPGFGNRHVENITSCPNNNYLGSRSCPRGQMNRTPCRYFPNGTCFRGASCPYLHTSVFGMPVYDSGSQRGQQLVVTSGQPDFVERTTNVIPRCNQHDTFMSHRVQQQSLDSGTFSQENQDISSKRGLHSFDDGKIEVKLCRKLIMGRCELGELCRDLHSFHAAYVRSIAVGNEQPHFKSSTAVRDSGVLHQSSASSKDSEPTETQGDDKVKQDSKGLVMETFEISTSVGKNAVNAVVIGSDSTVFCEKNNHTSPVASVLDKDSRSEKSDAVEAYSRKRKRMLSNSGAELRRINLSTFDQPVQIQEQNYKELTGEIQNNNQPTLPVQIDDSGCCSMQTSDSLSQAATTLISKRKLLVLDLNGILVDIKWNYSCGPKPDIVVSQKGVFKRPFVDDFLEFCFERFDVGVWSSRVRKNLDKVVDFVMGDSKKRLLFCWDQSHCTQTGFKTRENREKPLVLKELRKLWEKIVKDLPWERGYYNETNTVLLDDSPYKALRNPPNTAIFLHPYSCEMVADRALGPDGDLRKHLIRLSEADNVPQFIEANPFGQVPITESSNDWGFYHRIVGFTGKSESNEGVLPEKKGSTDGTSAEKNGSAGGLTTKKNESTDGAKNGSINEALAEKNGSTNDPLPEKNGSTNEVTFDKSGSVDGALTMKGRKRRKTNKTPSVMAQAPNS